MAGGVFWACTPPQQQDAISGLEDGKTAESLTSFPQGAPVWLKGAKNLRGYWAIGIAYKSTGGARFQQTEATVKAKDALREKVLVRVSRAVRNTLFAFSEDNRTAEKLAFRTAQEVSTQVVTENIREAMYWDPQQTLFLLSRIPTEHVNRSTEETLPLILREKPELLDAYTTGEGVDILRGNLIEEGVR